MSVDPAPLRILLLGGFEVWSGGRLLRGFESQKVRALLAYLACHRGRALSRDHLAGVFWGEKDGDSARRNLRQAVYNLKATLPGEDSARPHLVVDSQELRFDEASDYWLDVEAFERAVGDARGGARGAPATHRDLVGGMQHYRGDLLSGFLVKECPEFEEWVVTEQERLRERALEALRTLVAGYLERGEYRLGVEHARRLVAMDPLSEEAHRHLMRLYELGGHRARALAHYADLRELLRRELGVEPLAETRTLHESILGDALRAEGASERAEPLGPIVPMVGRDAALAELTDAWQTVLEGTFQATLLVGEEGVGKTRLARSFLDAVTARRPATVLVGLCYEQQPQASCGALVEALRQALSDGTEEPPAGVATLSATALSELACLLPELGAAVPAAAGSSTLPERGQLGESVAELLRELTRDQGALSGRPLILFLDDLQWADAGTLAILEALPCWLAGTRVWLLATCDSAWDGTRDRSELDAASAIAPAVQHPLARLHGRDGDGVFACVGLERLAPAAIEQIAGAIVDRHDVAAVAELLGSASQGLPLAIVTLVNAMWDERQLVAGDDARWSFRGSAASWTEPAKDGLDKLLLRRVRRLPTSTRRLASMAAMIGLRFDTELLQRAEDEHAKVVEVGLELLLERWLVRQYRERWNPTGLESSLALWSRGAKRGRFLFDHPRVRSVLYGELNPIRRQVLHGQVAAALEKLHEADPDAAAEELAHHALLAGQWERAFSNLARSAQKATAAADPDGAAHCWTLARRAVARLLAQAASDDERRRWQAAEETVTRGLASAPS